MRQAKTVQSGKRQLSANKKRHGLKGAAFRATVDAVAAQRFAPIITNITSMEDNGLPSSQKGFVNHEIPQFEQPNQTPVEQPTENAQEAQQPAVEVQVEHPITTAGQALKSLQESLTPYEALISTRDSAFVGELARDLKAYIGLLLESIGEHDLHIALPTFLDFIQEQKRSHP